MGLYAVTGAASGIGAAVANQLKAQGHAVITVDLRNADINVDLSSVDGRSQAVDAIRKAAPDGLDGFVPCAGVGPQTNPITLVARINYFGTTALVEGLKDTLAKKRGSIVLISSNSAWIADYDQSYMDALLEGDEEKAVGIIAGLDGQTAYGGSKQALARWMRRNNLDYAKAGIRMNAVAPGYTRTALTEAGEKDPTFGPAIKAFVDSIPIGRPGEPEDQAEAIAFLLSDKAGFISGSVLYIDGGHDAMFRSDRF
jgi:NAD(P)-dependent dehydrogenase (short-subunit alcohol dehydrogenase family)